MVLRLSLAEKKLVLLLLLAAAMTVGWHVIKLYKRHSSYWEEYYRVFREHPDPVTYRRICRNKRASETFFKCTMASMSRCKDKKIVFAGLCQDNGDKVVDQWMPIVAKIGGHFKDYRMVIVENDSLDNTRKLLLREMERNRRLVVLCGDGREDASSCKLGMRSIGKAADKESDIARRVGILSRFRQVYWDYVQKTYGEYDYICVLDWDLMGDFSLPGFFHGLSYVGQETDVIACNSYYRMNGRYMIYDTFPMLNHHRCSHLEKNKRSEDRRIGEAMRHRLLVASLYPVPVESAFGGVAIYAMEGIQKKKASYSAARFCPVECEHSTLHRGLTVAVDPWMTFYIKKNLH